MGSVIDHWRPQIAVHRRCHLPYSN